MTFVPLVNADNIQLLTRQNWLDLNIKTLAFSLEALLIKPGLAVLINQPSLARFLGWPDEVWLITPSLSTPTSRGLSAGSSDVERFLDPADRPRDVVAGLDARSERLARIKIRSPFDGSTCEYTHEELNQLIAALKPDQVYTVDQLSQLNISDEPLKMARQAQAYDGEKILQLTDSVFRDQYIPLRTECACPTCKLQFTRAYLHHLWPEVPALCQRYLAMHNIFNH